MSTRGPLNPYAPPGSDGDMPPAEAADDLILADRGTRLGSAMIDGLLFMLVFAPAMIAGFATILAKSQRGESLSAFWWMDLGAMGFVSGAGWVAMMGLQAYLVSTGGQSIGKRVTGIKIVKVDGSPAGFVHGVLLRNWLPAAIGFVPILSRLSGLFGLVDALFIFRGDRRCVHDLIAGTKVVRATRR